MANEFQDHPFWDYSLSIYGKPGVADSCLFLQDRYGFDVNLLLFCVWIGASGRGLLDAEQVRNCIRRTSDWRERVVEPLRSIRDACRRDPLGVPEFLLEAFRPLMRSIELDAEHVEQLVLAETVRHVPGERVADEVKAHDAQQNLLTYIEGTGVEVESGLDDCLRTILRAAFPGSAAAGPG